MKFNLKSIMESITKKGMMMYLGIGAVLAILHFLMKSGSLPLTRISDALFAGFVVPAMAGCFFWMKDDKKSCVEPIAAAVIYLAASVVFMIIAMLTK